MIDFFKYDSGNFHNLNLYEWMIPSIILYMSIFYIYIHRDNIKANPKIDIITRSILGSLLAIFFILNYLFLWLSNGGIDVSHLPIELSSISMILVIILTFTKNKYIFKYVIFAGFISGLINMFTNTVGYSYEHFAYYQFMITNGLIAMIPIYFLFVHEYHLTIKNTLFAFLSIQITVLIIFAFNVLFGSTYMDLVLNPSYSTPLTSVLGGYPLYLVSFELIGSVLIFSVYGFTLLFNKKDSYAKIQIIETAYMTKKRPSRFSK